MSNLRRLVSVAPLLAAAACGGSSPPPSSPPPRTPAAPSSPSSPSPPGSPPSSPSATAAPDFDPVPAARSPEAITALCDDHLAKARALFDRIRAKKGAAPDALTYKDTLGRFDDAITEISDAQAFPYLMAVAHPDKAVREAAKLCDPKVDALTTAVYLDGDIAAVLKAYAAKGEKLEGEKARLLSDVLRDFRRNGLDLPPEKQAELRKLNAEITEIGQKFEANISASTNSIEVDPKSLDGLPPDYVAKHPKGANGKVTITTDYPDFFPFATYAKDRKAALDLYVQFSNRGGDENVKLLERLLALRYEKAKLLGYPTWADYATETRMAKSAKTVRDFLERVRAAVKEPAKAEFAEMMKEHVALGGKATDALPPVDRYYLEDRVRQKKYNFDSKALAEYFEVGAVTKGLLDITAKMYGLEYRQVPAAAWHPDVIAYEVWTNGAGGGGEKTEPKKLGKFYLDLYPRADKYKHAAMFPLVQAKRLEDGRWQMPQAALACNFPKPDPTSHEPALMKHDEVVVFFHEFGHVLHHILTTSELGTYSGSNTVRDFVEAPSQMFEEWAWSRDVLDLFARHYKTGQRIPDALYTAMQRSRAFGRAMATQRQLFLAILDQEYHSRAPGFDTTKVVEEVQNATDPFRYVKGTHFQSSFGHLVGYDAGYYSYQWALSLSRDVLTRFKKEGMLNPKTAAAWRDEVLSRGGGVDERSMVARFLGREPNDEAYVAFLKGHD